MGEVYFYHLTRRPLEATLPILLGKCLEQDWRVAIHATDQHRLEWLDEKLWLSGDDVAFLPHGLEGGAHDQFQPILLTTKLRETFDCVMSIDGAPIAPEIVNASQRTCVLFDGTRDDAVQTARQQWKLLTEAKCSAQYWSEESGRWEKKAESKS